jgi:hypothetical protein
MTTSTLRVLFTDSRGRYKSATDLISVVVLFISATNLISVVHLLMVTVTCDDVHVFSMIFGFIWCWPGGLSPDVHCSLHIRLIN